MKKLHQLVFTQEAFQLLRDRWPDADRAEIEWCRAVLKLDRLSIDQLQALEFLVNQITHKTAGITR